jgi:hypothetical protein
MEITAVKGRSFLGPHCEDEPNRFFHLPNADRGPLRKFPAILAVLRRVPASTDAKRQPPVADQIDAVGNLRQMRRIAVADGGGERGQANAAGHGSKRRQDGPAFHEWLDGRGHAGDLDQMVHDRKPDVTVVFGP